MCRASSRPCSGTASTRCAWRYRCEEASDPMSLQVLVVDDETLARSRLRTLLGECAAPAATVGGEAGNAVQAMDLLRRLPFDAVLLDIHMPGADGLALAQAMRSFARPRRWCSSPRMPNTRWRRSNSRLSITSPSQCG